jgi:hypothetical protein
MADYNNGVYDAPLPADDDGSGSKKLLPLAAEGDNKEMVNLASGWIRVLVVLGLCTLMYRAIARREQEIRKQWRKETIQLKHEKDAFCFKIPKVRERYTI